MVIVYSDEFLDELGVIADHIAKDSNSRANNFMQSLKSEITKIPDMPYSYRKNRNINRETIRDLIFKGYTVTFSIGDDRIEILGIYKRNLTRFS
nr:type II toxin-antitoxin system RelE/ParE family toxin [uncultured Campylobacter sp.]